MAGYYELVTDNAGEFRFNLKAGNHEVILSSEGYKAKASALNGIESVQKNSQDEDRFETRTNSKGEPYFILKAGNGQEIGRSEYYSSEAACANGIESVKKNGPSTEIKDKTEA
jgi:uncharacterized protein